MGNTFKQIKRDTYLKSRDLLGDEDSVIRFLKTSKQEQISNSYGVQPPTSSWTKTTALKSDNRTTRLCHHFLNSQPEILEDEGIVCTAHASLHLEPVFSCLMIVSMCFNIATSTD